MEKEQAEEQAKLEGMTIAQVAEYMREKDGKKAQEEELRKRKEREEQLK